MSINPRISDAIKISKIHKRVPSSYKWIILLVFFVDDLCLFLHFLQLSLQNQQYFKGKLFLAGRCALGNKCSFITKTTDARIRLFFPEETVTKHKVNRSIAKYLKWGALISTICYNRGDFMPLPRCLSKMNKKGEISTFNVDSWEVWLSVIRFL